MHAGRVRLRPDPDDHVRADRRHDAGGHRHGRRRRVLPPDGGRDHRRHDHLDAADAAGGADASTTASRSRATARSRSSAARRERMNPAFAFVLTLGRGDPHADAGALLLSLGEARDRVGAKPGRPTGRTSSPGRRLTSEIVPGTISASHEDRHLQRQRHPLAPAAPARMARARAARRRLPAGAEGRRTTAFPSRDIASAGYGAIWHGPAVLERRRDPGARAPSRSRSRARPAGRSRRRRTAATSRPRSTASSSRASTCPTATRSPGRSSTTSWRGSSA